MRRIVAKGVPLAVLALAGCGTLMLPGFKDWNEQSHFFPESVSRTFPASAETTALAVERACAAAGIKDLKLGLVFGYTKADLKARRDEMAQTLKGRLGAGRFELDPELLATNGGWLRGRTEQGAPVIIMYSKPAEDQPTKVLVHVGEGTVADRATAESLLAAIGAQLAERSSPLTPEERSALIWRAKVDLRPVR
jgi:hypothetical protein